MIVIIMGTYNPDAYTNYLVPNFNLTIIALV